MKNLCQDWPRWPCREGRLCCQGDPTKTERPAGTSSLSVLRQRLSSGHRTCGRSGQCLRYSLFGLRRLDRLGLHTFDVYRYIPESTLGFRTVGISGLDFQSWCAAHHRCCPDRFNFNNEVALPATAHQRSKPMQWARRIERAEKALNRTGAPRASKPFTPFLAPREWLVSLRAAANGSLSGTLKDPSGAAVHGTTRFTF